MPNADQHVDNNIRMHYKDDENKIKAFVEQTQPDLIIVSTNCLDARRVVQRLRKLFQHSPYTTNGDNLIPYYKSIQPDAAFQGLSNFIQEAISLVRLRQNPLCEILSLWRTNDNPLLNLPMQPYQHLLSREKLQEQYEDVAVEVVNKIGIDLNDILQFPHLEAPFAFICGLGPRKAKFILDSLRKKVG